MTPGTVGKGNERFPHSRRMACVQASVKRDAPTLRVKYVSMPGFRLKLREQHYGPHGRASQEIKYSFFLSIREFVVVK